MYKSNFDQMHLILKVMDEFSMLCNSVVKETGLCCFFLFLSPPKKQEGCSASYTLLILGFYHFIFCGQGIFFQHSTNEVKKLGAETSSVRFRVGLSDGRLLKMRWHFCFSCYTHIQTAVSARPGGTTRFLASSGR